ncbi:MAG: FecR domain-containing protein [Saprospiraceae bacterium]
MNIDQIIGKLLSSETNDEERIAIENWKKEAEENVKALKEIQQIAKIGDTLKDYQDFNTNSAWSNFEEKIESQAVTHKLKTEQDQPSSTQTDTPTKVFTIANLIKIAAVIAIVFGAIFAIKNDVGNLSKSNQQQSYVSNESQLDFILNDGSQITLDKKSSIDVNGRRKIKLKGRSHFDIAKDKTQQFVVDMPVGRVVVLGTQFTIDAKKNTTELYVIEGKVRYELGERTVLLTKGDYISVVDNDIVKSTNHNKNIISWKTNKLVFREDNMVDVFTILSKHYKKEIIIEKSANLEKCGVTTSFVKASLQEILNEFTITHGLKYLIKNGKVFVVSSNC